MQRQDASQGALDVPVSWRWKALLKEETQKRMMRVGTACRTTSSNVKSSSRKTRPVEAEATLEQSELDCGLWTVDCA